MDELTMLVQVAGGEQEAASRLHAAGLHKPKDLAQADVDEISSKGGLSAAAARRLVKAAKKAIEPPGERPARSPRSGLAAVPPPTRSEPWPEAAGSLADVSQMNRGVSQAESSDLTGEPPPEEDDSQSFWGFG